MIKILTVTLNFYFLPKILETAKIRKNLRVLHWALNYHLFNYISYRYEK